VTREHENGLIPTREFTLGSSDFVPSEYPHSTLTKSILLGSYDDSTGTITGYKANIDSFTSYIEETERQRAIASFAYAGWITGQNYYGVQVAIFSDSEQFISSGFDTGDYRLSTYKYNGTKLINRVKVLSSRHIYGDYYEYQTERYDEDGNDITTLNDGNIVVVENQFPFLIGTVRTDGTVTKYWKRETFPFLIGTVRTRARANLVSCTTVMFPFLIGTVRTHTSSIPHLVYSRFHSS